MTKNSSLFRYLRFALLIATAGFFSSCEDNRENQLVVGMELKFYPFEYTTRGGENAGVSVDLARGLAEKLGKELVIRDIQFSGLITALQTGEVDCVISSMTKNEERMKSIDFSDPYVHMGLSILAGINSGINGIDEVLAGNKKIAVNTGTTGHLYAEKHLKKDSFVVLSNVSTCVLGVVEGKYDAFLFDQVAVFNNWKAHPKATKAILKPFQEEDWAIGIRKGNDALRTQVNEYLKQIRDSGKMNEIAKKHLSDIRKEFEKLDIEFILR